MPSDFLDHWTIFAELMTPTQIWEYQQHVPCFSDPKKICGEINLANQIRPPKKTDFLTTLGVKWTWTRLAQRSSHIHEDKDASAIRGVPRSRFGPEKSRTGLTVMSTYPNHYSCVYTQKYVQNMPFGTL